jgi:thiol-disulfide isomerase/thioredoxin
MSNNNIVSILHNDYIKRYKTQITIFIVIIIFVIASIFAYKWFIQPTVENLNEDLSNDSKRTGESQLYFFHADWCPHCKRAKPEWDNIVKNYDNKDFGKYKLKTIEVDCSEGDDPLIQQYSIDGYPTILMIKDDKRIDYDAKISYDNLDKFITDLLQ